MGQPGDIPHNVVAADVPAHGEGHGGGMLGELPGLDHVPDAHGGHGPVGHLNAHGGDLVGHRRDADAAGAQRQGDVVAEVGDLAQLHALIQGKLISGHAGPVDDLPRLGIYTEGPQRLRQPPGIVPQLRTDLGVVAAPVFLQQCDRRVVVRLLALGQLLLDSLADLLGCRLHLLLQLCFPLLVAEGLLRRGRFGGRLCRCLRRRIPDGLGRRRRPAPQHLVRRAHIVAAPGKERLHRRQRIRVNAGPLAVQGNVDIRPLFGGPRRLFRGLVRRRCGKILGDDLLVLILPQTLPVAAHPLRRLLGRHVQRPQQRCQQQHDGQDDGHHLAQQRRTAHRQHTGQHTAAAQRLPIGPESAQEAGGKVIHCRAQQQVAQHAHQQRQHRRAERPQDHRPALMTQLDIGDGRQCRRGKIIAVAQCAPQHLGRERQQQRVHVEIAHQDAQRQQRAHHAAHHAGGGVIGRRLGLGRRLTALAGDFLLCRCHTLPHFTACRTRVSTPTAQQ